MKRTNLTYLTLSLLSATLLSIPYLIPGCGFAILFGFVPLLAMDSLATAQGKKHFWHWHYLTFTLWNAATTFWVCNATVGGGIFAVLANALQMSLIFGLFRLSKKYMGGSLPYILLVAAWIAWERYYLTWAQISWPWLVLGNAFAGSIRDIQWYEFTGTLGGSLWVWAVNLGIFGMASAVTGGRWKRYNKVARGAAIASLALVLVCPPVISRIIWKQYEETGESLDVLIAQPDIDPYNKFTAMTQKQQNALLTGLIRPELDKYALGRGEGDGPLLILAPETFTSDVVTNNVSSGETFNRFVGLLQEYPFANLLFGASSYTFIESRVKPSHTARNAGNGYWRESHNSALITDATARWDLYHKSKLVVGVESTPYPAFFCKVDDLLGGLMGRCIGQPDRTLLNVVGYGPEGEVSVSRPIGCAVCYESIYGEFCTEYVKAGAQALAIITNDAWWGDTPGYRQHLHYASLRAIETRRDIARCANTGISAFINQRGEIVQSSTWWTQQTLEGRIRLNERLTFFAEHGDITGRLCIFIFILLACYLLVGILTRRKISS